MIHIQLSASVGKYTKYSYKRLRSLFGWFVFTVRPFPHLHLLVFCILPVSLVICFKAHGGNLIDSFDFYLNLAFAFRYALCNRKEDGPNRRCDCLCDAPDHTLLLPLSTTSLYSPFRISIAKCLFFNIVNLPDLLYVIEYSLFNFSLPFSISYKFVIFCNYWRIGLGYIFKE